MVDRGDEEYEVGEDYNPEEETHEWAGSEKKLNLPEVPVLTGEEDDEQVAKFRCKLYRWVKTEWKERGTGDLRFLKNKSNNKIRIVLRQDKTHKVVANFFVSGQNMCELSRMKSNDKSWIWTCYDCSDLPPTVQKLCGRLVSKEDFEAFEKEFKSAYEHNSTIVKQTGGHTTTETKSEEKKEDTEAKPEAK